MQFISIVKSIKIEMDSKMLVRFLSLFCVIIVVHSTVIKETNVTKSAAEKSAVYYDCTSCYSFNNMVCVNAYCYCKPNYYYTSGSCMYKSCSTNSECETSQDYYRRCSSGSCVCDSGYHEDSNNGRKCTHGCTTYSDCNDVHSSCLSGSCVCDTGYSKDVYSGKCTKTSSCTTDLDCPSHSSCLSGSCYCDSGYSKSSLNTCTKNGCTYNFDCPLHSSCYSGKCYCDSGYYADSYGCSYSSSGVGVWAWAWLFFLVPVMIGIGIWLRLRRRRMLVAQAHVVHTIPVQQAPPPYNAYAQGQYAQPQYAPQQQQNVNVQRY